MSGIKTTKDKPVLVHERHMYRFDRSSADNGKFWRCVRDGCLGRIKTDDRDVFVCYRNDFHNHLPDEDQIRVREVVSKLKERAEAETTPITAIYRAETAALSSQPHIAAVMPTYEEVSKLKYVHLY
jgi:hypothetical protein